MEVVPLPFDREKQHNKKKKKKDAVSIWIVGDPQMGPAGGGGHLQ